MHQLPAERLSLGRKNVRRAAARGKGTSTFVGGARSDDRPYISASVGEHARSNGCIPGMRRRAPALTVTGRCHGILGCHQGESRIHPVDAVQRLPLVRQNYPCSRCPRRGLRRRGWFSPSNTTTPPPHKTSAPKKCKGFTGGDRKLARTSARAPCTHTYAAIEHRGRLSLPLIDARQFPSNNHIHPPNILHIDDSCYEKWFGACGSKYESPHP